MKTLITFPFNFKDKTEFLLNRLNGDPLETLYLAPHISKLEDFKLKYHYSNPNQSLLPSTHTLKTLGIKLINEYSDFRIISEIEKYIIILTILQEKRETILSELNLTGLSLSILQFIKDIKISGESGIDTKKIKDGIEKYNWKFEDNLKIILEAINVMEKYEDYLEKNKLIDSEDIYLKASGFINNISSKKLLVEGFYEIPPYQKVFMKLLLQKVDEVDFSFCYDKDSSPDVKDLILDKTFFFLEDVCNWKRETPTGKERENNIKCYNFSSQPEEIKGIIKIISENFVTKKITNLNDVMLVFPSMLAYRSVVQRVFGRYNLPCKIVPGYSLSQDSAINTLLSIFSFGDTYNWEALMGLLTSPHFTKINEEKAKTFSIYSRERFERTGFFKENFLNYKDTNLKIIKSLIKNTEYNKKTSEKWVKEIYTIIDKMGWTPGLPEVKYTFDMVLEALKTPISFTGADFLSVLKKSFELIEIQEGLGEGVKVSGVMESVGIEKKLCFLGGATEENLPQSSSIEELFIPDNLKKQLGFTDYNLRVARERLDIHRLKKENDEIIFTYPSKISGKNQMKSIFLFEQKESVLGEDLFVSKEKNLFNFKFSREKFYEKFVVDGKLKISVTQLESFLQCPFRFYIEKVEGFKVYAKPEIGESPDKWGQIIHKVMQEIFEKYKGFDIPVDKQEELKELFKVGLINKISELQETNQISVFYRDVMSMRIEEVTNKFNDIVRNHYDIQLVGIEEDISQELKSLILKGKIDRIEKDYSGNISIIDIKTGTSAPPSYTEGDFFKKSNIQLPLYIWMYKRKHKIEQEYISGSIWNFSFKDDEKKKNEIIYASSKFKYLNIVEDYLEKISKQILEREDFVAENPENCFFCNFKDVCPYEKQ
ncbi:PD-(D/E)XK nuclease family protein [bacterium]|nr:PD-(D/E)XK nuclease family protein [bacterium]